MRNFTSWNNKLTSNPLLESKSVLFFVVLLVFRNKTTRLRRTPHFLVVEDFSLWSLRVEWWEFQLGLLLLRSIVHVDRVSIPYIFILSSIYFIHFSNEILPPSTLSLASAIFRLFVFFCLISQSVPVMGSRKQPLEFYAPFWRFTCDWLLSKLHCGIDLEDEFWPIWAQ